MRRKDREITDRDCIDDIIEACDCCRLGFCDEGEPYIVPLNFGYDRNAGVFYFHSAREGKKIDLIQKNGHAAFELDTNHAVNGGERACDYSFRFQSVMGSGHAKLVEEPAEKEYALRLLMNHYTQRENWSFSAHELHAVAVIKLTIETISCKRHD